MSETRHKAVFIDKDGTLIPDIPYNVDPQLITLNEGVIDGMQLLAARGFVLILISNQAGVAYGYFKEDALKAVEEKISALLAEAGISIAGYYFCPHHKLGKVSKYAIDCNCRKPKPGMILEAAKAHDIDLTRSFMIGDILNDVEAGKLAGCRSVLIDNGNENEWIMNDNRNPDQTVKNFKEAAEWIVRQQ